MDAEEFEKETEREREREREREDGKCINKPKPVIYQQIKHHLAFEGFKHMPVTECEDRREHRDHGLFIGTCNLANAPL